MLDFCLERAEKRDSAPRKATSVMVGRGDTPEPVRRGPATGSVALVGQSPGPHPEASWARGQHRRRRRHRGRRLYRAVDGLLPPAGVPGDPCGGAREGAGWLRRVGSKRRVVLGAVPGLRRSAGPRARRRDGASDATSHAAGGRRGGHARRRRRDRLLLRQRRDHRRRPHRGSSRASPR